MASNSNQQSHTPPTAEHDKRVQELIAGGMKPADAIKKVMQETTSGWTKLGAKGSN